MASSASTTSNSPADAAPEISVHAVPPPIVVQRGVPWGLIKTARPKQWVKNILVFAAPAAAGQLFHRTILSDTFIAFLTFTLASIATYYINDAADHRSDRLHPKKRHRPIAAGIIDLRLAWTVAIVCLIASLGLAWTLTGWKLAALLAGYVTLTLSYSFWLKHLAVIELACVAAGFILRMIAGGIATGIPISDWFLTVASFSSLFVVAGKRYGELQEMGEGQRQSRAVLGEYTLGFLRSAWGMAMAVSVAAYCQWAFERANQSTGTHIWYQLSAVPWVLGLLRYALLLERGHGGAPEDVLLSDRTLLAVGALWLACFGLGIYVH